MFNLPSGGFRTNAIRLTFLSMGIVMAATTAYALARPSDEFLAALAERTPQSAIDETFETLRSHSVNVTRIDRPQIDKCSDFRSSFLDPHCVKNRKKRVSRVHRAVPLNVVRLSPSR